MAPWMKDGKPDRAISCGDWFHSPKRIQQHRSWRRRAPKSCKVSCLTCSWPDPGGKYTGHTKMSRWANLMNLPLQYLRGAGTTNCGSSSAGPRELEASCLDTAVKHPPLVPDSLSPVATAGLPETRKPLRSSCLMQTRSESRGQWVSTMAKTSARSSCSMYSLASPDHDVTLAKYM